ncbi:MAG: S41 family peptidase, partial [Sphingobacterium sp.]
IGYLKIVEFMHPRRSMQTAIAAMKFVENTDALVIDLRGNGGGYPDIMEYILNHYFEGEPKLLSTTQWSDSTLAPMTVYSSELIYSKPRVGTPLYVLIDKRTASAAEYFAYTLQAFKNATIIGERSAGAANMNTYFPLSSNFRISISTGTPINAITNSNWELKGVQPDVKAKAADAECVAYQLFRNKK